MKKLVFGITLLGFVLILSLPTMAQVNISVNIGLPPPIVFHEPPVVVVLPDTYYVYAVPDIEIDLFFWNGWWWRPWHGRWYRSHYYDRGWVIYQGVPSFYFDVDPHWRAFYRDHDWRGHRWYYERIDYGRLQRNWQNWRSTHHWEKQQTWGVQEYRPAPQQQRNEWRQERQREYHERPEVREYQQQRQQQRPQVQQPRPQPQPREQPHQVVQPPRQQPHETVRQPQREEHGPQGQQPQRGEPRGKPEGAGGGHEGPGGKPEGHGGGGEGHRK